MRPNCKDPAELVSLDDVEKVITARTYSAPALPTAIRQAVALARLEELVSAGLHPAREAAKVERLPPYDLRHEFASLQIRAGMSVPELAEQMGHSPAMTLRTYTHVIREFKGEPIMAPADQIEAALQERRGRLGDIGYTKASGA